MNKIIEKLNNKNVVILGFGMEGKSTLKYIRKYSNMIVTIMDDKDITVDDEYVIVKKMDLNNLDEFDIIIKTPGIFYINIKEEYKNKIYSQLEFLYEFVDCYKIAVTGSKGKSTTASLLYKIVADQLENTYLVGNIGIPILDYVDKINKDTILIIETAAQQLGFTRHSPNMSILLNLYEEHLDHFGSKEYYYKAKLNNFIYQTNKDYAIYSSNSKTVTDELNKYQINSKLIDIENYIQEIDNKLYINNIEVYDKAYPRNLIGEHNFNNIKFALVASSLLKLDTHKVINSINEFVPLEHRLEKVGIYNKITYYNDSISTIPEATINACLALKEVNTLIIGGKDRGINYSELISFINESNIENIICLPDTGIEIGKHLNKNIYNFDNLEDAVNKAKEITKENKICLLSPAASSYNMFKNFEERGTKFKEYIKKD